MSNIDHGGPAFPTQELSGQHSTGGLEYGMSLRDWFAGMVVASVVGAATRDPEGADSVMKELGMTRYEQMHAAKAYEIADAMIAEKRRTESK